ncbi:nucleoside-diphosphate sugar epimerase/dehydratase [Coraliomargarita sp. SDUM461003]|uniref:Nucleoside-diphosphate sugar epimerase/dehydratase n=1 Tax=Thalassobacterium maritimum TaxID=3041265 RepID=A0ABU1AT67_9BACT|nr:nucleoside-diphosphate sugar epimerase/dehydratase [Coraliomargarita sp. SDUM461003]MDQ8207344.1 nucleoside-diphosphate sugar epimerase/dehydratase [Coraliomargarita sp. SDUM461003]
MKTNAIVRYFNLRTLALALFYALTSIASYWAAYELRFDFNVPENHSLDRVHTIHWVVGLQLMLLMAAGQFDSILSYFRLPDALRLFGGLFANALILLSMWYVYKGHNVPPRAVILTYFLISFLAIASFRVIMRIQSSRGLEDWFAMESAENVLIIGAGEIGAGLCSDLMNKSRLGMRPVAFLDDDTNKVGRYVHGVLVANIVDEVAAVAKRYNASKVVIAFPSASVKRMRQVAELARDAGLAVDTVPALTDLVSGRAELSQLRPIELEDLLGRDTVDLNSDDIRSMLAGKRVLVTGAGGSIGSELVAQILSYAPSELLCVDQAEIAIFNLRQNVLKATASAHTRITTRVLDILNQPQLDKLFEEHRPEVIFHAAAHKHVNLMEDQPTEALQNNFLASKQLARIASAHAAERLILISSDKAINPTSVMGASKRLAELALGAQQNAPGNNTKFMAVRFGNVLGSSGSVIPIFRKQIATGGPITVTDPEVTRFFMTVEEAVGLVLQSATQGSGGEIFVLDMGESVKIVDVARQMIALSGLRENTDIDIEFIGLQPGEKLYEEVQHLSEELQATRHARVMRFVAPKDANFDIEKLNADLQAAIAGGHVREIKQAIQKHVPEYTPSL